MENGETKVKGRRHPNWKVYSLLRKVYSSPTLVEEENFKVFKSETLTSHGKMTTEGQIMSATTSVGATNIATSSRTTAPPSMAPAEKPGKFSGIDFKRWQQKMFFYLTTLCLQRFTSEDAPEVPEGTSDKDRFVIIEAWKHSDFLCRNYILSGLQDDLYNVYSGTKTAKELDRSTASHSFTLKETIAVASTEIHGAIAYEVSVFCDCVYYFTVSRFYSGVVAGARESLFSVDFRKKDESQESDFKDAVGVCLPLINAALRDIEKGAFPKCCLLHVQVPKSPLTNKGAAHQLATQKNNIEEVESVGVAGKSDTNRKAKYF
ncbi:hypothetical protein CQW23_15039 [Capsicum baccatum]|uniref:Uncharacterized protein n=1 Tax=Capsicum baccatum TaxID=33114 RepID=A0A2G2WKX5_CAPBA|nr:hypothetical protein CQW23_15039 [Capsicum baccatum]